MMQDPWKYLAFPAAAVAGYALSQTAVAVMVGDMTGLADHFAELAVVALSGLVAGFIVDEMIPAYIEKTRGGSADGDLGGDMGGGSDDFDFD